MINLDTADKSLQEKKEHGNLEYPVALYDLNLTKLHTGYIRWHWHEEMEISIVKSGIAEVQIADESYQLSEGEGILINQNVLHTIHPVSTDECIISVIVFHPAYLFGYGETYMCTKYLTPIVAAPNLKCYYLKRGNRIPDKILNITDVMMNINSERKFGYEIGMKGCLCSLWLLFLEICVLEKSSFKETNLSSDEARSKHAILFIQDHYNENITLESIASAIHVSKSECCRCFKRTLKMTPFEYLIKYRIFMATLLIVQNNKKSESIAELATTVGFNSTSYFNKWFRHYTGYTPTQYRRQVLAGNNLDVSDLLRPVVKDYGVVK